MQNHEGSVLHTQTLPKRQSITVRLHPGTIKRLDELAARSERSRSNIVSLILNAVLLAINACDIPNP